MSIELPEAKILADQLNKELVGKCIKSYDLKDYERLQRIGMLDKDTKTFDQLVNGKIKSVVSRGNVIRVKLDNEISLILAPEYGGRILYHTSEKTVQNKFHLKVNFGDNTILTVRLTSMGIIQVLKNNDLQRSYVYRRDFNPDTPSPFDEVFTSEHFSMLLKENNRMLKSVLVGKDAVLVGLSNSTFQDAIYRARLHPKRKAADLKDNEQLALYDAINLVVRERIRLNGKCKFYDIYGNNGCYTPAMGPNMKQQTCPECRTPVEKLGVGGGHVYFCPTCQK